jgi:hypothetical protein
MNTVKKNIVPVLRTIFVIPVAIVDIISSIFIFEVISETIFVWSIEKYTAIFPAILISFS